MPVRWARAAIRSGPASMIVPPSSLSSTSSVRQSTSAAPGMWPAAWTCGAGAVRPPAEIEDPDPGPPEILGQPFGGGEELRAGQATHARYHTGRGGPLPSRSGEAGGGPHGDPVAGRGHLPEHRVGRAVARRDGRRDGRHGGLRTRRRPRPRRLLRRVHGPDGRGAGRCRGRPGHGRRGGRADPRDDGRHERRDPAARLARGRPGGHDGPRARRARVGPLYALRDRFGVDVAFVDAGDDGDDERTIAAFDAAITPRPGSSRSRTSCGRPVP